MNIFEFTQRFLALGIAIMPLYHRSKVPMLPTWRKFQTRLPTHTEYLAWFPTNWNNYGVIAGWNNLVILDFDTFELFDLWRLVMRANGLQRVVATSFKVITSHGMHVYLRTAERAENSKRIARSGGIDVQAQSKYVVGPGSIHPNGTQYVPVGEMRLLEVPDVETVLPVAYFPKVTPDPVHFVGTPVQFQSIDTEYCSDPLQMATDTRDLITKVKAMTRIQDAFPSAQRSSADGRYLKTWCPFHNDNRPGGTMSFWIDTVRQVCGCQRCGMKPMDIINLYARQHNISERDAVSRLAEEIGVWR